MAKKKSSSGKKGSLGYRLKRGLIIAVAILVLAPVMLVVAGRWINPFTTMFIVERYVQAWDQGDWDFRAEREWVDWDRISRNLPLAVMSSEDQRFPDHNGFDWKQVEKAYTDWQDGDRLRGASTISQQLAKNLFLWSGQSWVRKGLEVPLTYLIELTWSKQRILEVYLNVVEFGDGIYGAQAAALTFYREPASSLSMSQAARMAAVLPNPKKFIVDRPSNYVMSRQRWIVRQMNQLGYGYLDKLH
ncbi:monofunctional biosynthetic peptidoglycan transglycosylase [Pokkaliibacter sp. CJK22405]|uniref:monofunctional biosynthetic peptidoglycan transglycosylase n=1 Tax=Pokkaliibacter sp. CJK22405 TaxID=3384615 RepID=UPI003984FE14